MQFKKNLIKWFMSINMGLIRMSNGKIGTQLGKVSVLILHTTGRKSGKDRAIPIAYYQVNHQIIIVASNWGRKNHPGWYLNLLSNPVALLEIKGASFTMAAREAQGDEYNTLWNIAVQGYPPYKAYRKKTTRHIPIMVFYTVEESKPVSQQDSQTKPGDNSC